MVDELTNESFQAGKAIVTVSVDLITAIAEACRCSEQANPTMTNEQRDTLVKRVSDKVASRYKETHGSLKSFNRDGKDVTSIDVSDERTAEILKDVCKKSRIPVDMKPVARADGSKTYTAFCEVKNLEQVATLLKNSSEQVLEEQRAMTKEIVLYNEHDKPVFSQEFVKDTDIDYDKLEKAGAVRMEIKDSSKNVIDSGEVGSDVRSQVKEKAEALNPQKKKKLKERIAEKREKINKDDKDKNRERTKKKKREQTL